MDEGVTYRDIPGFPGYRVGDDGSVWTSKDGRGFKAKPWRKKKPTPKPPYGHLVLDMYCRNVRRKKYAHRLVLEAFVGPCPPGMEACHKDGNPKNNALSNLRWGTSKENGLDMVRHGTSLRGERNPRAKLAELLVKAIRADYESGMRQCENVRSRKMDQRTVNDIVRRRRWKHA